MLARVDRRDHEVRHVGTPDDAVAPAFGIDEHPVLAALRSVAEHARAHERPVQAGRLDHPLLLAFVGVGLAEDEVEGRTLQGRHGRAGVARPEAGQRDEPPDAGRAHRRQQHLGALREQRDRAGDELEPERNAERLQHGRRALERPGHVARDQGIAVELLEPLVAKAGLARRAGEHPDLVPARQRLAHAGEADAAAPADHQYLRHARILRRRPPSASPHAAGDRSAGRGRRESIAPTRSSGASSAGCAAACPPDTLQEVRMGGFARRRPARAATGGSRPGRPARSREGRALHGDESVQKWPFSTNRLALAAFSHRHSRVTRYADARPVPYPTQQTPFP